jgi:alpha-L-fucosidase 2
VPSYSPENWPANSDSAPTVINAVMDISVCKEVLTHLIQASEILGTDADQVTKWKAMLAKMPPYLLDTGGALKEWAWPTLEENQDHRHASHLYGVWPSDELLLMRG